MHNETDSNDNDTKVSLGSVRNSELHADRGPESAADTTGTCCVLPKTNYWSAFRHQLPGVLPDPCIHPRRLSPNVLEVDIGSTDSVLTRRIARIGPKAIRTSGCSRSDIRIDDPLGRFYGGPYGSTGSLSRVGHIDSYSRSTTVGSRTE